MGSTTFILICAAELTTVLLFIIVVLIFKNKKLQKIIHKLKTRNDDIKQTLKELASQPAPTVEPLAKPESYRDKLNQQLILTKNHHHQLGTQQDIALDLDPEAPAQRRTAALRNAFLIAEKEASSDVTEEVNWDLLSSRYQQLLDFNTDYSHQGNEPAVNSADDTQEPPNKADGQTHELARLRSVAADQLKTINELQEQLRNTENSEEQAQIMGSMQEELQKQARFLQESETCVQLMDNELSAAKKELAELRGKAEEPPSNERMELQLLRKELSALQTNYNDLEERFLDLKLQD